MFMTESISADYGAILIELVLNDLEATKIVYLLQEGSIASIVSSFDVDAGLMTTSLGTGTVAKALSEMHSARRYLDPSFVGTFLMHI